MYHANVTKLEWHPVQPELLLARCEGDNYGSLVFAWDPLSNGPRSLDMAPQFPGTFNGKTHATWIRTTTESAAIFYSNNTTCMVASLADSDQETLPWEDDPPPISPNSHQGNMGMQSSPTSASVAEYAEDSIFIDVDDDTSELDDTFQFISQ